MMCQLLCDAKIDRGLRIVIEMVVFVVAAHERRAESRRTSADVAAMRRNVSGHDSDAPLR